MHHARRQCWASTRQLWPPAPPPTSWTALCSHPTLSGVSADHRTTWAQCTRQTVPDQVQHGLRLCLARLQPNAGSESGGAAISETRTARPPTSPRQRALKQAPSARSRALSVCVSGHAGLGRRSWRWHVDSTAAVRRMHVARLLARVHKTSRLARLHANQER
eukprot:1267928-Rhodomonas_salina.1